MLDLVSDDLLRAADKIVLVDPNRPGWQHSLYVRFIMRPSEVLKIPVDSRDHHAIQEWYDRVRAMNLDD